MNAFARIIAGAFVLAGTAAMSSVASAQSRAEAPVPANVDDAWSLPAPAPVRTPAFVEPERGSAAASTREDAQERIELNFTREQPVKPGMFDAPTAWEDEP